MRLAFLAPLISPLAPPFEGGAQVLLSDLAAGLARRGHAVTLYAANHSSIPGVRVAPTGIDAAALAAERLQPATPGARASVERNEGQPSAPPTETPLTQAFAHVYDLIAADAGGFDLLHAHAYDWAAFAFAARQPLPVVHTLHLPNLDPAIAALLATHAAVPTRARPRLVTVSHACAATFAPAVHVDAVLYNGIPVKQIPFRAKPDRMRYLLFAGRISPEKGVEDALEIAARAGRHLILAGGLYDEVYYTERIAPRLERAGASVSYIGLVNRERLWTLMGGAEAVLFPVQWDEPFGLVACEAQATGTPVIAYAHGGLVEVVADGTTGRLVPPGDVPAAVAAVEEVGRLDRRASRAWVEQRFSLDTMLDAYERFYADTLARSRAESRD